MRHAAALLVSATLAAPGPVHAAPSAGINERLKCLADAYPGLVRDPRADPAAGRTTVEIGGRRLTWDDGVRDKSLEQRLASPDLEDMLASPYPAGQEPRAPAPDDDPGRVRVAGLFDALYGATPAEVARNLEVVVWPAPPDGRRLKFNRQAGAAAALRRVGEELARLPVRLHPYFTVTAGAFNPRRIAGTDRKSAHSWGIAIDLNPAFSDYWRWAARRGPDLPWRNRMPVEIVRVFERHGFVWGGRWYHYDTMHFEYRPELLDPRCARAAAPDGGGAR